MGRVHGVVRFGLLSVLVGCSSSSGGGAGGDGGSGGNGSCSPLSPNACSGTCNPCARLMLAQVQAAVSAPVMADQSATAHGPACGYSQKDSIGAPLVSVTIDSNIHDETFQSICHGAPLSGTTITPVTGVGDSACYLSLGSPGPYVLNFEKGCWSYSVQVTGPAAQYPEATIEADEKTIALDLLPSL